MTHDWYYKAVQLDRTSHYDGATKWRKGSVVRANNPSPPETGPCGRGIHCSPTLLDAVGWQRGPSRYYRVRPHKIIAAGDTKVRCNAVTVGSELSRAEQDEIAGFKLWEANHPFNPFTRNPRRMSERKQIELVNDWASVWEFVKDSVWNSICGSFRSSVGVSVWTSVRVSVWDSVMDLVGNSGWNSVKASVGAYTGGLFPAITNWRYIERPDPWRPLLTL